MIRKVPASFARDLATELHSAAAFDPVKAPAVRCPDPAKVCIAWDMQGQIWQVGDCVLYDGVLSFYQDGTGEFNAHVQSSDTNDEWAMIFAMFGVSGDYLFQLPEYVPGWVRWYIKHMDDDHRKYHWHIDFVYDKTFFTKINRTTWFGDC